MIKYTTEKLEMVVLSNKLKLEETLSLKKALKQLIIDFYQLSVSFWHECSVEVLAYRVWVN